MEDIEMKLEGKVTGRRLKQVNPEILTSILLVSATILALIMSNTGLREEYHYVFNDIKICPILGLYGLLGMLLCFLY